MANAEYQKLLANARAAVAAKATEILEEEAQNPLNAGEAAVVQAKVANQFGNQQKKINKMLLNSVIGKFRMNAQHPELPPIVTTRNREFVEEHLNLLDPQELNGTGINLGDAEEHHKMRIKLTRLHKILERVIKQQPDTRKPGVIEEEKLFILTNIEYLYPELKALKQKMYHATNDLFDEREEMPPNQEKLVMLEQKRDAAREAYIHLKQLIDFGREYMFLIPQQRQRTRKQRRSRNISLKRLRKN